MISGNKQIFYSGKTHNPTQQKKIKYRATKWKNSPGMRVEIQHGTTENKTKLIL